MKTRIFISHSAVPMNEEEDDITILPSNISFSDTEDYSTDEFDTYSFLRRISLNPEEHPVIAGALKEEAMKAFDAAASDGYDQFYFLLSESDMNHYNPILDEYKKDHDGITIAYYNPKSSFYVHMLLAKEASCLFASGKKAEEVTSMLSSTDLKAKVYLYSPEEEMGPAIEKFSYDEDITKIRGKKSYMYIFSENKKTTVHLKEKYRDILSYIELYRMDVKNKSVYPFVLYTDENSKYTEYFLRILKNMMPEDEILLCHLPEWAAMEYGIHCVGFGFAEKLPSE